MDWRASKQDTVTTSSTEAELLALLNAAKEAIRWKSFFEALMLNIQQLYSADCNNLQTICLMKEETPKLIIKLRHVDIHQSWLREEYRIKGFKPIGFV